MLKFNQMWRSFVPSFFHEMSSLRWVLLAVVFVVCLIFLSSNQYCVWFAAVRCWCRGPLCRWSTREARDCLHLLPSRGMLQAAGLQPDAHMKNKQDHFCEQGLWSAVSKLLIQFQALNETEWWKERDRHAARHEFQPSRYPISNGWAKLYYLYNLGL